MKWKRKHKPYAKWHKRFAIYPVKFKTHWAWLESYEVCYEDSSEYPIPGVTLVYNMKRRHTDYGECGFWSMMAGD